MILVDTSAFIALVNSSDLQHKHAVAISTGLRQAGTPLGTTSYIVVETTALVQRRLGFNAASTFLNGLGDFELISIDPGVHKKGVEMFNSLKSADISLVDCVTFCVMRSRGIKTAFAFDKHFTRQGFLLAS